MGTLIASADRPRVSAQQSSEELLVVRVASLLAALSLALQIAPVAAIFAYRLGELRGEFVQSRGVLDILGLVLLPWAYAAASGSTGLGIYRVARHALRNLRGNPLGILGVVAGLAYAFAVPYAWVVGLGETGSLYWYLVYLAFLPSSLLTAAQIALLQVAIAVRRETWPVPILSAPATVLAAVGGPLLIYGTLRSFPPEFLLPAALGLSTTVVALDLAMALLSRPP